MKEKIEQSVFLTLAYFDIFNFPLTKEELFVYLWRPPQINYEEFLEWLDDNCHPRENFVYPVYRQTGEQADGDPMATVDSRFRGNDRLECKFGYYFLPGRDKIVEDRRRRLLFSELKMKIARRAIKKIRAVPFLRAVFVCNNVGAERAEDDSDIDLFVVAKAGRLWIVRFFINFILRLWGLRTYGDKIKNKICVSFLVDDRSLSLSNLRIVPEDIHFAYWLNEMIPLYDPDNLYPKFLSANSWTKEYLPNLNRVYDYQPIVSDNKFGLLFKKIWETMWQGAYGGIIENQAKSFQFSKMKTRIKEKMNNGDKGVIISDSVIKLHENDRRREYKNAWEQKIK